jgi:uncharacterized protein
MIIDFHTHIFPPQIKQNRARYLRHEPFFRELYSSEKAILADAEELVRNMDDQKIDISAVQNFQWTDPEVCHLTNCYIAESIKKYPDRLIGFGMVCLDSTAGALEEIKYCVAEGMRGIGEVRPPLSVLSNADLIDPVISSLISNGLILCTHSSEPVGHIYPGKGDLTPSVLYQLISRFPELKIDCAHWGGGLPLYMLMPEVKKNTPLVYFDSAASPYLYQPAIYTQAAALAGGERILFGSDYPLLKPSRLINEIDSLNLDSNLRERILSLNARSLLQI